MTITAQLHDGRVLEFPDGTDSAVIQRTVKTLIGSNQDVSASPEQSLPQKIAQQGVNLVGGALRHAAGFGEQLLKPRGSVGSVAMKPRQDQSATFDQAVADMGADKNALAFKAGGLAHDIALTGGVGGALSNSLRAIPSVARAMPGVIDAIGSAGFTGPNMLSRMAGGGITGGAAAAMVDPEHAGTGAAIGAVLPPALKVAGTVGKSIGGGATKILQHVLGITTGVGPEPIKQAFKAGVSGNKDFADNLAGNVPLTDILDRAKQGLSAMTAAKSAEYRSGMIPIGQDKTVLSLSGIDKAVQDAAEMTAYKGQVKNDAAASAVSKMKDVIDEWKALNPADFHTPEGLDALKQKLGGILESIPFQERTARTAAGKIYNATKSEIEAQAPAYAGVMKDYSEASAQISEIERALSLGDKASKDTAMRKLQSLMRNNVQTNYGNRLALANTLEQQGGVDLLPSIAGQALNSWTPRSLAGQLGSGTVAAGGLLLHNPLAIPILATQSPRLVGNAAYGVGRLAGMGKNAAQGTQGALPNSLQQMLSPDALQQLGYRVAPVLGASR